MTQQTPPGLAARAAHPGCKPVIHELYATRAQRPPACR